MTSQATLLHLRIPFSFYLLPVFSFAAGVNGIGGWASFILVFLSIHLFLYPASNGFNSYYDRDEGPIGGLEKPPPVSRELLYVSLLFDAIAIALGLLVSLEFAFMLFIYGMVSKAYSHPAIRLKKYGLPALLTAAVFQGGFTYLMVTVGLQGQELYSETLSPEVLWPAALSTGMILGFYPLTQVYQHEEDAARGDNTISLQLGIRGTFIFSAGAFLLADAGFYLYFARFFIPAYFLWFQLFCLPMFGYFAWWFYKVVKDEKAADFKHAMRMNKIAAWCLVLFFCLVMMYWFTPR